MPRFFVEKSSILDGKVVLDGENAHHVSKSLRMAPGEIITVCDREGNEYECELVAFTPDTVTAKILSTEKSKNEPPYIAHVFQGLPKGDKLDSIIQKSVECGAYDLTTFDSSRCIAKDNDPQKKLERRQKIATEAAKQCGRAILPEVFPTVPFKQAVDMAKECDLCLFCYEEESGKSLFDAIETFKAKNPKAVPTVSLMVGSEGGFSKEEAEYAKAEGMTLVGLGKRILRTETAASFVLSCLVYAFELSK